MKWKQDLDIKVQPLIEHNTVITSVGSCFSTNIGQYLKDRYFKATVNPLGILFNPVAVEAMITRALKEQPYAEHDATYHHGVHHLVSLHGSCQNPDLDVLLKRVNREQEKLAESLRASEILLLTLGTAIVYRYKPGGYIAGNNHKLPLDLFERHSLTASDVRISLIRLIRNVRKYNPKVKVILTVSPVRHLRNGTIENQLSKSTLLVACHDVLSESKEVYYFPAYEIMMDELRDYRFYAEDLVHPSEAAIGFIWRRFVDAHFTTRAKLYVNEIDQLNAMRLHRPLFPDSPEHKNFVYKMLALKKQVMSQWNINLPDES